jgi:hypothetical protein
MYISPNVAESSQNIRRGDILLSHCPHQIPFQYKEFEVQSR